MKFCNSLDLRGLFRGPLKIHTMIHLPFFFRMCEHFFLYKDECGLRSVEIILTTFVYPTKPTEYRNKTIHKKCFAPNCSEFSSVSMILFYLQCIYFGCYTRGHIKEHLRAKKHFRNRPPSLQCLLCFL